MNLRLWRFRTTLAKCEGCWKLLDFNEPLESVETLDAPLLGATAPCELITVVSRHRVTFEEAGFRFLEVPENPEVEVAVESEALSLTPL